MVNPFQYTPTQARRSGRLPLDTMCTTCHAGRRRGCDKTYHSIAEAHPTAPLAPVLRRPTRPHYPYAEITELRPARFFVALELIKMDAADYLPPSRTGSNYGSVVTGAHRCRGPAASRRN